MNKFKKLYFFIQLLRFIPHVIILMFNRNNVIYDDAKVWVKRYRYKCKGIASILYLLNKFPEFRTIFYYRVRFAKLFSFCAPGQHSLYIKTKKIGKGLFIQHGFSTIITAESIGENCWINQQVTIGWTAAGAPVIGDNVRIGAGAIVIGNITIGNNSTVGAGTTVNTSIPENALVVGAKPRVIENHIVEKQ